MPSLFSSYLYVAHRIDGQMARRFCRRLSGDVLDVGCGRQPYRRFLPAGGRYTGLDPNPEVDPDVVGGVLEMPLEEASFDAVMCNEVLEHVPDPAAALVEIGRVLRPGGRLYLTVPQAWGLHYEPQDYYRYTRYGIAYLLNEAGFTVDETRRMGGLFSYFAVRLIDLFVTGALFRTFDLLRIRRGRYRVAALLTLPLNVVLVPLTAALDRMDRTNAYGWAVLATKRA